MKSDFSRFTKPLLLGMALCLAPIVGAQDSKRCTWSNDGAHGLFCFVDQNTPLLPNGTTKDDPARLCARGPVGDPFDDGCIALWYDAPEGGELLPVPWKEDDLPTFLAFLDKQAAERGDKTGWCLADALPAHKVEVREEETTDEHGRKSRSVTYRCEGEARACKAVPNPECELGHQWTVRECDANHWLPDKNTVAKGERFTQTNGCGVDRPAEGTANEIFRWVLASSTVSRNRPRGATSGKVGGECREWGAKGYQAVYRTKKIYGGKRACEANNKDGGMGAGNCVLRTESVLNGYQSLVCGARELVACNEHAWTPSPKSVKKGQRYIATNDCGDQEPRIGEGDPLKWQLVGVPVERVTTRSSLRVRLRGVDVRDSKSESGWPPAGTLATAGAECSQKYAIGLQSEVISVGRTSCSSSSTWGISDRSCSTPVTRREQRLVCCPDGGRQTDILCWGIDLGGLGGPAI